MTVIGCIRRSEPPAGGAAGTSAIPASETRYWLSNITLTADPDRSGAGVARSDLLVQAVKAYRLDDATEAIVAPHVGDRVEVKGPIVPNPSRGGLHQPPPSSPNDVTPAPTLHVESVKTIASNSTLCSQTP